MSTLVRGVDLEYVPSLLCAFLKLFIFSVLGLCCCARAFSSFSMWWLLFPAMHGLLIVVGSRIAEHSNSRAHGLNSCGSQALEQGLSSCGTWALLLLSM